jgi:hypothetical protein
VGKSSRKRDVPAPARVAAASRWRVLAAVVLAGAAVALAWALWRPAPVPATTPAPAVAVAASPSPLASRSYDVLLGQWVRPDGGYVLSISQVAPDGKATVGYFNPRPIRVSRAEARREGDLVGLFVELNDVNYPGSTYNLGFDTASGQLRGVYYQALERQKYQVVFVRQP